MTDKDAMIRAFSYAAIVLVLLVVWLPDAGAQIAPINVELSEPGKPMMLQVNILSAEIQVIGEKRDDVQITISGGGNGGRSIVTPSGVQTIDSGSYKMSATERNNTVNISSDWRMSAIGLVVRVPVSASLSVETTNNSTIDIEGVAGEMQLQNVNGPITVKGAASSVIAESVNRTVDIAFASLSNVSAVSLTSVNGDLFVGLPERPAVQLHIDTSRGKIASDFDIDVQPSKPVVSRAEGNGKVEISIENLIIANINGGGPVVRLKTLNGDIQINRAP
ncbi:MAG: hypothetical protein AB8G17_04355 [Gammaproteobacteria bacterium]